MIPMNEFRRNQSRFPLDQLEKYNGQYVAWSPDGVRIVAAHADPTQLDELIKESGHDPADTLVSLVAVPEDVAWNGWSSTQDQA